jgi:23S rRNA pseudouridine1911/1915/1917 synthase
MRNKGYVYREILPGSIRGDELLDHLTDQYPHSTREEWQERIRAGQVHLDGDQLSWHRPPWDEPDAPRTFGVLHQDNDLLAVAKPAGLPTLPGGGFLENSLLYAVREFDRNASPLHRLGRWTSGLVLFARNRESMAKVSEAWRRNEVRKIYRGLAEGEPARQRFNIDVPIGPVPHPLLGTVHGASKDGKPARSRVTVLERREGCFLAEIEIETGRPHQIRIHLAAFGHPLCGDRLYRKGGLPAPDSNALPGEPGYHLHAMTLELAHPADGRELKLYCGPPRELEVSRRGSALGGPSSPD